MHVLLKTRGVNTEQSLGPFPFALPSSGGDCCPVLVSATPWLSALLFPLQVLLKSSLMAEPVRTVHRGARVTGPCPCDFLLGTTVSAAHPGAVLLTQLLPANCSSSAPGDWSFGCCRSGAWSHFWWWQGFQLGVILQVGLWIPGQHRAVLSSDWVRAGPLYLRPGPTLDVYSLSNSAHLGSECILSFPAYGHLSQFSAHDSQVSTAMSCDKIQGALSVHQPCKAASGQITEL